MDAQQLQIVGILIFFEHVWAGKTVLGVCSVAEAPYVREKLQRARIAL